MRKLTRLLAAVILPAAILSSSVPYIAGASPAKTQKASRRAGWGNVARRSRYTV